MSADSWRPAPRRASSGSAIAGSPSRSSPPRPHAKDRSRRGPRRGDASHKSAPFNPEGAQIDARSVPGPLTASRLVPILHDTTQGGRTADGPGAGPWCLAGQPGRGPAARGFIRRPDDRPGSRRARRGRDASQRTCSREVPHPRPAGLSARAFVLQRRHPVPVEGVWQPTVIALTPAVGPAPGCKRTPRRPAACPRVGRALPCLRARPARHASTRFKSNEERTP